MVLKWQTLILGLLAVVCLDFRFFAGIPGALSFSLSEAYAALLLLLALASAACFPNEAFSVVKRFIRGDRMAALYIVAVGGSVLLGTAVYGGGNRLEYARSLMVGFVLYVGLRLSCRGTDSISRAVDVYIASASVQAVLGIFQYFGLPAYIAPLSDVASAKFAISGVLAVANPAVGLFGHPNGLALMLLPAAIVAGCRLFAGGGRGGLYKSQSIAVFCILVFGMFATQAKGPIAWLVIGFVVAFVAAWIPSMAGMAAMVSFGGGVSVLIGSAIYLTEHGHDVFGTMLDRIAFWRVATKVMGTDLLYLVLGAPPDAMLNATIEFARYEYSSSHNTYLDIGLLFGVPVLVIYLLLIQRHLRVAIAAARWSGDRRRLGVGLSAAVVAVSGAAFFEPALAQGQQQLLLLLGLSSALASSAYGVGRAVTFIRAADVRLEQSVERLGGH